MIFASHLDTELYVTSLHQMGVSDLKHTHKVLHRVAWIYMCRLRHNAQIRTKSKVVSRWKHQ